MHQTDLKEAIKKLMNERSSLEEEIELCSARLEAAGVGGSGPLVDREVSEDLTGSVRWQHEHESLL